MHWEWSSGFFNVRHGLIQTVIDHYDANISSMDGLKSSYAMPMLLCQSSNSNSESKFEEQQINKFTRLCLVDNIWVTPDVFKNIYPRLGGLHTIMSFCDSLGKLMIVSGLNKILKHAFGCIEKCNLAKKYSRKVRAFGFLLRRY